MSPLQAAHCAKRYNYYTNPLALIMMKTLLLLIIGIILIGCNDLNSQKTKEFDKSETNAELWFSLYNATDYEIKNITVGLPNENLKYKELQKHSQTESVKIESTYRYGYLRFYDKANREYLVEPIDFVGEKLYKNGHMKFIIKSIDTLDQYFVLDNDYDLNK